MLIQSNDTITYFSDFRVEIARENLDPTSNTDFRTIAALVNALNDQLSEQQRALEDQVRAQLDQPNDVESLSHRERELLILIREQGPTLGVGVHFSEGSLIAIGSITISIVLGNPTLRGLLLSIGSQLLGKVAASGIQRGIRRILERLGWRVNKPIIVVLVPAVIASSSTSKTRERMSSNVALGVPITLLTTISFLLFAIFVLMLVLGFAAHVL